MSLKWLLKKKRKTSPTNSASAQTSARGPLFLPPAISQPGARAAHPLPFPLFRWQLGPVIGVYFSPTQSMTSQTHLAVNFLLLPLAVSKPHSTGKLTKPDFLGFLANPA